MAGETVVQGLLTQEMINAGADLLRRLDSEGLPVTACLWLYLTESSVWRLIIASPDVTKRGPKKTYQKLQSVLSSAPEGSPVISLKDIGVVERNKPPVSLPRKTIKTGTGNGISGVRFSNNAINGQFIEDA